MQRLSSLRNPSCFRNPLAKARERTGPRACARGVDSRRQHSCGAAKARRRQLGITRPASCLPRTVRKLSRRSATGPFFRRCSITRCGAKSSADSRCGIQARTTRRAASQGRRQGREDAVSAIAGGDQRAHPSLGHANIATTHIYDHRKTRAWKTVRLKEQY